MINTDGIVSISSMSAVSTDGLCSIWVRVSLTRISCSSTSIVLDGDRRNQHRLAADPVAGVDHQIPDVPPRIHEEILDVADLTVCRVQVKTLQVTCLVKHMQPSR